MSAEVDLHDVTVLQHCVVAVIRGVVRGHVVNRAASRESNSSLCDTKRVQYSGKLPFCHVCTV